MGGRRDIPNFDGVTCSPFANTLINFSICSSLPSFLATSDWSLRTWVRREEVVVVFSYYQSLSSFFLLLLLSFIQSFWFHHFPVHRLGNQWEWRDEEKVLTTFTFGIIDPCSITCHTPCTFRRRSWLSLLKSGLSIVMNLCISYLHDSSIRLGECEGGTKGTVVKEKGEG